MSGIQKKMTVYWINERDGYDEKYNADVLNL
jgi:hypothetical protein